MSPVWIIVLLVFVIIMLFSHSAQLNNIELDVMSLKGLDAKGTNHGERAKAVVSQCKCGICSSMETPDVTTAELPASEGTIVVD